MKSKHPDMAAAAALFEEWGAGWGEYVCWDVIQGYREKPCVAVDGLTDEQFAVLERLRDEHKCWLKYGPTGWRLVPIEKWRAHTVDLRADDVSRLLEIRDVAPELEALERLELDDG